MRLFGSEEFVGINTQDVLETLDKPLLEGAMTENILEERAFSLSTLGSVVFVSYWE